ncbi:MAG: mannitol dehydrogenase family protein [Jatrophihabitantaceae bacterium]
MSAPSRAAGPAAAPVRLAHLGLGNFFRAHQAWYTDRAPDADQWGIAAFGGRGAEPASALAAQDGLFTLLTRGPDTDSFELIASISRSHAAGDHDAWLDLARRSELTAITLTVTEAGYLRRPDGGLDDARPAVQADIDALRRDRTGAVRTAPARLVAALAARRAADAGPLAIVPCDNLPDNGAVVGRVTLELADAVDPDLAGWIAASVSFVPTMVDRITPRTQPVDLDTVRVATGVADRCPVVTEPFSEWVLCGAFPCGRPAWEEAGARFVDNLVPHEQRKLWLLNGAHSLLAYAGSIRGHVSVAAAIADPACLNWVREWWDEAGRHLALPADELAGYRIALLDRWDNPRIEHLLSQIAADGSQKLPVRIVPVIRLERAAGRLPAGAARVLGAWVAHVRGLGVPLADVRTERLAQLESGPLPDATRRLLGILDPTLPDDDVFATAVTACAAEFESVGT